MDGGTHYLVLEQDPRYALDRVSMRRRHATSAADNMHLVYTPMFYLKDDCNCNSADHIDHG